MSNSNWTVPRAVSQFIPKKINTNNDQRTISTIPETISNEPLKVEYSDRLKVFVGTWNMYGRLLDIELSTFLTRKEMLENTTHKSISLDGSATHPYHLLIIGTQECERDISEALFYPSKEIWENKLKEYLGSHYRLLKTETLAALHIAVFVWLPVAYLVKDVKSESIKTGWANMIGNKGAVAVSVLFGTRSLLFINCHLTAHQAKLNERNANVQRILSELKMPSFKKTKKARAYHSVIDQFDHVFLFGDTNYRINAERPFVLDALRQGDYNTLLEYDQLSTERRRGSNKQDDSSPLRYFQEHPIQFPPTYKLDTVVSNVSSPTTITTCADASTSAFEELVDNKPNNTTHVSLATSSTSSLNSHNSINHKIVKSASAKKKSVHNSIKRRLSTKKKSSHEEIHETEEEDKIIVNSQVRLFNNPDITLCYDSSEKQRVPSWTDRILWCDRASIHHLSPPPFVGKTNKTFNISSPFRLQKKQFIRDTICYSYDAVVHESLLGVSDHMPVIGVFGIWFDEWHTSKIYKLKKTATISSTTTLKKRNPLEPSLKKKKVRWWQKLFR